jgi:YD repeat-containing protein
VQFAYDTRGRLDTITRGNRIVDLDYDASGRVAQIKDPLQQSTGFEYDLADRVKKTILPDGRQILYTYDDNGNVTSVTPPSRPAHSFTHTPVDLAETYTPPQAGPSQDVSLYTYNLDRQLTRIDRPDAAAIELGYDTAGRLETLTTPSRQAVFGYNAATGLLSTVTALGVTLSYSFDGSLMTSETWSGTVSGTVGHTFDNDFHITSQSVSGAASITFGYDHDGLLTSAGSLTLTRDPQNGLLTGTTLLNTTEGFTYNGFREAETYSSTHQGSTLLAVQYTTRDPLGRIESMTETVLQDPNVAMEYT